MLLLALWGVLGLAGGTVAMAQPAPAQPPQWQAMTTQATSVAVTPSGDAWALDASGAPWRLAAADASRPTPGGWALQPGRFTRLRATLDGALWALDEAARLYRLQGSVWRPAGESVRDVAAAPDGTTWWLLADGQVVHPASGESLPLPTDGPTAAPPLRLLCDEHGLPWLLLADGRVLRRSGNVWHDLSAGAPGLRDLAIGGDGTVLAVTEAGMLLQRIAANGSWQPHPLPDRLQGQVAQVAMGAAGLPWLVMRNGTLLAERPAAAGAATPATAPALFTRLLSWRPVGGRSQAVAIGPDGTAISLADDGSAWHWQGENRWRPLGGRFGAVAAGSRGMAWGLATGSGGQGTVHEWVGGFWRALPGSFKRLSAGPENTPWAISDDDQLWRWQAAPRQWARVSAVPAEVRALAIGPSGQPWIIAADGGVQRLQEAPLQPPSNLGSMAREPDPARWAPSELRWQAVPGVAAASLAIGPDGTVYATAAADASLVWLDRREMQWKPANGSAIAVAVGPEGAPWIVTPGHALLASGRFLQNEATRVEAARAAAAAPPRPVLTITPAVVPSTLKPLSYTPVFSADLGFLALAIGGNGAVFAVGSDGGLFCFSNSSRRFLLASPGAALRVAVSSGGQPWLLNRSGVVSRFEKGAWQAVADFLGRDLSIGPDGQAWAVDRAGEIHRLAGERFERVPTLVSDAPYRALRVAGAQAGVHWVLSEDKRLLRCEKGQCATRLTGVQDVAVAPDNTVFVLDLAGRLRRANALGTAFELQNGTGVALAVGPQGLPWLLSADGKVSSSGLFNPLSRTVNTDACVHPFAQSPAPVEPPAPTLQVGEVVATLPPGGSMDLLARGRFNGRPLSLDAVGLTLNEAGTALSLRDGQLLVAATAALGTTQLASYTVCPRRTGAVCGTARLAVTVAALPDAPRDATAVAGNGQATVAFQPPSGSGGLAITGYAVTAHPGGLTATGSGSPIVVSGLANGATYTFTVSARNALGLGPASLPSTSATPSTVPAAPTGVVATAGPAQASVSFAAPVSDGGRAIAGYRVTAAPGGHIATGATSPILVTGLADGTAYTFNVVALNANGPGAASLPSAPVTPRHAAGAPTGVVATAGNAQASVAFAVPVSDGGSGISSYTVTASPGGASASGSASPITITGLTNGTSYTFTVSARNAAGLGTPSLPSAPVTPGTVPDAPTGVTAARSNQPQAPATVSFVAPANTGGRPITAYEVTATPGGAMATGTGSPIIVGGLDNGTAYTFVVRALNLLGASAPSAPSPQPSVPGSPSAVVATLVSASETTLTFAPPVSNGGSPITGYRVASDPAGPLQLDPTGLSTPLRLQGLQPGVTYRFTVSALNAVGAGVPSAPSNSIGTSGLVPGAPTAVVATRGNAQATVGFAAPAVSGGGPITGYTVTASPGGASASGAASPIVVNGIANGTAYTFTVRALNAFGSGAASVASAPVTPATVPSPPTSVIEELTSTTEVRISFTAPSSNGGSAITGYRLVADPPDPSLSVTLAGPTMFRVTGLGTGRAYTFAVVASNALGDSLPSAPSGVVNPAARPSAPGTVSAVPGNASITVHLLPPVSDGSSPITGYTVVVFPITANGEPERRVSGAANAVSVPGLTNGVAYCYYGWASNANGRGPSSPACPAGGTTPGQPPGPPTAVFATPGNGQATLSFVAPASSGSGPITHYAVTASPGGATATGSASPIVVPGLTNGTAYTFTVRAVNPVGIGTPSIASAPVTPMAPQGVPSAPGGLFDEVVSASEVRIGFTPPASDGGSPITGYRLLPSPSDPDLVVTLAGPTLFRVQGLNPGRAYTFSVVATNAVGDSPPSASSNVVNPSARPSAPTAVVGAAGIGQVSVSFSAPASSGGSPVTGYTVTASPGGATASGTASPIVVTGLTSGTAYTFTVRARNAFGDGAASAPSAPVVPIGVPSAPLAVVEELTTISEVTISFSPPASTGGSAITGYRIVASPTDPALVIFPSGPASFRIQGLTFTRAYTFSVVASNAVGDSPPSAPSRVVNPSTRPLFPGAVSAVPGNGSLTVNLLTPASDGGSPITSYTVVVFPITPNGEPERRVSGPTNAVPVSGLTNGVAYCYYGWASNANGRGATSPACPAGGTTPTGP